MTQPDKEKYSDQFGRSVRALSDYIGLGLQIAVSFAFFVLLGYWADGKLGTSPLFLLVRAAPRTPSRPSLPNRR
ncbi:MAG: AtpZ/AtpI family protein, partial [Chlorobiaceae bacterium]|nr:AtpZ/AtpI family protein [Chlorobiaceae bacterium]